MLRRCAVLLFGLALLVSVRSESPAQKPDSSDPGSLLDSARHRNGLTGPDIRPWHIHGSYKIYNDRGQSEDAGTYEEWWLSPAKYKLSFASPRFTQTDYADGSSLSRDGAQEWSSGFELSLREQLIDPLPPAHLLADMHLAIRDNNKFQCISMVYQLRQDLRVAGDFFPAACFELTSPVLRISSNGGSRNTVYNNLVTFQGHYLAKQLQVFQSGKLRAELNLDTIELIKNPPESLLTPPSTAKPLDLASISFPQSSFQAFPMALKKVAPEYPPAAKSAHIVGTIKISVSVDSEGHVRSTTVIDGPSALRVAAETAVKQWVYRPPVILGAPRPFHLEIKVIFTMG